MKARVQHDAKRLHERHMTRIRGGSIDNIRSSGYEEPPKYVGHYIGDKIVINDKDDQIEVGEINVVDPNEEFKTPAKNGNKNASVRPSSAKKSSRGYDNVDMLHMMGPEMKADEIRNIEFFYDGV